MEWDKKKDPDGRERSARKWWPAGMLTTGVKFRDVIRKKPQGGDPTSERNEEDETKRE